MATPLEELKKMQNSNHLTIDDWKLLKDIATSKQHTFRPCNCNKPVPASKIQFTLDSSQNYNSPHAASTLGKVYNRFKCSSSAYGCKQSFSPVHMLTVYQEGMAYLKEPSSQLSGLKRSRSQSPPFLTQPLSSSSQSTRECATSSTANSTQATQAPPVTPATQAPSVALHDLTISFKLDTITNLFEKFLTQSNERYERSLSNFEKVISTLDHVTEKNLALEKTIQTLTSKLNQIEAKVLTLETISPSIHVPASPPLEAQYCEQTTSANASPPQPISNHNTPLENPSKSTSWAAIAAGAKTPLNQNNLRQKAKQSINTEQRMEGITALKTLALPDRTLKTRPHLSQTTALYIGGFEFQKLSVIWKALRAARFQTSRIVELQWIGKTVLEVVVASDYYTQFASEIAATNSFRILKFDPSTHSKATTLAQSETALRCFAVRIVKNSLFGRTDALKNHFQRVGREASIKNPQLKVIISEEWNRALATKNAEIASLEAILQQMQNSLPTADDVTTVAERLLALSPGHSLAIQLMENALSTSREAKKPRTSTNLCNITSPPASTACALLCPNPNPTESPNALTVQNT